MCSFSKFVSQKKLHVISFDVPYPPNYGGAIDVFYKLKSLHKMGFEITLHCFDYGRGKQSELEKYCQKVYYYKRNMGLFKMFSPIPFIVLTRKNAKLLEHLEADNFPILFEGLHSCYYLHHKNLKYRNKIVRTHNIEHDYYHSLAKSEKKLLNKLYFYWECSRLMNYEKVLRYADTIAAISANDSNHLKLNNHSVHVVTAFHPYNEVTIALGVGHYALYHGNLAVAENNLGTLFLVNEVFSKTNFPLIVAGSNPSEELTRAVQKHQHIELKGNISTQEIKELISQAHINILPTFQATGIKLKLLAALFLGRHCIVNTPMVSNTGLEELCIVKDSATEMTQAIEAIREQAFTNDLIEKRKGILSKQFSNDINAKKLSDLIEKNQY